MEVDVSMIIGYVMKFNYALPYNASYLTDPYVRYDRSISRRVQPDGNDASPPKGGCERYTPRLLSLFFFFPFFPEPTNITHIYNSRSPR